MSFHVVKIVAEEDNYPHFLICRPGRFHKPEAILSMSELRCMARKYAQEFPEDVAQLIGEIQRAKGASNG